MQYLCINLSKNSVYFSFYFIIHCKYIDIVSLTASEHIIRLGSLASIFVKILKDVATENKVW